MVTQKTNLANLVTSIQGGYTNDNGIASLTESFQNYIAEGKSQWDMSATKDTADMAKQAVADTNHKEVYEKEKITSDNCSVSKDKVQDATRPVDDTSTDEATVKDLTEEELTELQENIRDILKETLDVTDEEIDEILASMNMNLLSLLKPENLQEFMLTAMNAEPVDLLTDSSLVDMLQQVGAEMDMLQQQFGVDEAQLEQLISNQLSVLENDMPDEMVASESDGTGTPRETLQDSERLTDTAQQAEVVVESESDGEELSKESQTKSVVDTETNGFSVKEENTGIQVTVQSTSGKEEQSAGQSFEQTQQGIAADVVNQLTQAVNELEDVPAAFSADVQQAEIIQQVIEQIRVTSGSDMNRIEVKLYPQHLGRVQIQVMMKNGVMTAQIHAETEMAKEAIEGQLRQLKETFQAKNIQVEAVEVSVGTSNFQREQERQDSTKNQQETRSRGKRIRLDEFGMPVEDVTGEMSERSERLEAQGASVEFTA